MPHEQEPLIEVGWLILNDLDPDEERVVQRARKTTLERLRQEFARFEWRMPVVQRAEPIQRRAEPSTLLGEGEIERTARRWDFALVVTKSELHSHYKPYALATPSRALGVAVLSTVRLTPGSDGSREGGLELLATRLSALALHVLGDLNGVPHRQEEGAYMRAPDEVADLDRMNRFTPRDRQLLAKELEEVADLRLEEQPANRPAALPFYWKAMWITSDDIASAVAQAKPWEFPFRLGRLTTAAVSALLVVLITAEAWDLGMTRPPWAVVLFALAALAATSTYILVRQNLLVRRGGRRLSEQTVASNAAVTIVVVLGMATTYLGLFALTLALEVLLFRPEVVSGWAPSLGRRVGVSEYLTMAAFTATLGILIGGLGASFEGQQHFRHVAFVDEET